MMTRILLLLLLTPFTHATTWYVTTGGSDSNPCTHASPCATPDHAFNTVAAAGDTVNVGAGTYSYGGSAAVFNTAGTSGNPITVTCATRGACKITNTVTGNSTVVEMNNNYQVFDGFEVTNTGAGNNLGIYVTGHDVSLTHNIIHDIQTDCSSSGGGGIQIAVANLTNILIDSNKVYNISWVSGAPKCNSSTVQTDGILAEQTGFTTTTTITNNIVYNTSGGWGIGTSTNALIAHNTIFNTVNGGVVINNAPSGAAVEDNIIVYTGLKASDGNFYGGACAVQNGTASTTTYGHNELSNNHGGNYGTGFGCSGSGLNTGDIAVDPAGGTIFFNWQQNGSGDYHEISGSPTIGAGTNVGVTHDFDGHVRPTAGYDMGAYQFGIVTGISVSPTGGVVIADGVGGLQITATCTFTIGSPGVCPNLVWSSPSDALNSTGGGSVTGGLVTWTSSSTYQPTNSSTYPFGAQTAQGIIEATDAGFTDYAQVLALASPGGTINIYTTPDPGFYRNLQPATFYTAQLVVGTTMTIGQGFSYSGGGSANPIQFASNWVSSNTAVATVNRYGLVTAVGVGTVTITGNIPTQSGVTIDNTPSKAGQTYTFNVVNPSYSGAKWYVRPGGGTPYYNGTQTPSGQCDGTVDVDYPGSGTGLHCAFNNYRDLWADTVTANSYGIGGSQQMIIGAGDVVTIHAGQYNTGLDQLSPNYGGSAIVPINCGDPDCYSPTIPSGAVVANITNYSISSGTATITASNTLTSGQTVMLNIPAAPFFTGAFTVLASGLSSSQFEILITHANVSSTAATGWVFIPTIIQGDTCTTADAATSILNVSWSGRFGINFEDSQNVVVKCLQITQQAECEFGGAFGTTCSGSSLNYGAYGFRSTAFTSNIYVNHVYVKGIAGEGWRGATGGPSVVLDDLHIQGAPFTGIDMDDLADNFSNISVAGGLTMNNSLTEFTGCITEKPYAHNYPYIKCAGQEGNGQGDGFGTASTTGNWFFNNDIWRFNLQDGLDLLHSGMQNLTVTNSQSYGNIGNQYKLGSSSQSVLFQNNFSDSNCLRDNFTIGDQPSSGVNTTDIPCRAGGDNVVMLWFPLGKYTLQNNTMIGYATVAMQYQCDPWMNNCSTASTTLQNTLVQGWQSAQPGMGGNNMSSLCALNLPLGNDCNGSLSYYPANQGFVVRTNNIYNAMNHCPNTLTGTEVCNGSPSSSTPGTQYVNSTNIIPYTLVGEQLLDPYIFPSSYNGTYLSGTNAGYYPASSGSLMSTFGTPISGLTNDAVGYPFDPAHPTAGPLQFELAPVAAPTNLKGVILKGVIVK